jgi:hypothetical protein
MCFGPNIDDANPGAVTITATLQPRGPAAGVVLTDEQLAAIAGGAKTPPVTVIVNGGYRFHGRIGRRGGETLLGFNKAVREAAGVQAGDTVELVIALDDGPPQIDVPADLSTALDADQAARAGFHGLAPSHRKEWARWMAEAKKPETRERRIAETVAAVRTGQKRR